jgi:hypothetical protein
MPSGVYNGQLAGCMPIAVRPITLRALDGGGADGCSASCSWARRGTSRRRRRTYRRSLVVVWRRVSSLLLLGVIRRVTLTVPGRLRSVGRVGLLLGVPGAVVVLHGRVILALAWRRVSLEVGRHA